MTAALVVLVPQMPSMALEGLTEPVVVPGDVVSIEIDAPEAQGFSGRMTFTAPPGTTITDLVCRSIDPGTGVVVRATVAPDGKSATCQTVTQSGAPAFGASFSGNPTITLLVEDGIQPGRQAGVITFQRQRPPPIFRPLPPLDPPIFGEYAVIVEEQSDANVNAAASAAADVDANPAAQAAALADATTTASAAADISAEAAAASAADADASTAPDEPELDERITIPADALPEREAVLSHSSSA